MFSILNRALSWAITGVRNKFCLKKRSRLIKTLDNKFYVKLMQLEIGLLIFFSHFSQDFPEFESSNFWNGNIYEQTVKSFFSVFNGLLY